MSTLRGRDILDSLPLASAQADFSELDDRRVEALRQGAISILQKAESEQQFRRRRKSGGAQEPLLEVGGTNHTLYSSSSCRSRWSPASKILGLVAIACVFAVSLRGGGSSADENIGVATKAHFDFLGLTEEPEEVVVPSIDPFPEQDVVGESSVTVISEERTSTISGAPLEDAASPEVKDEASVEEEEVDDAEGEAYTSTPLHLWAREKILELHNRNIMRLEPDMLKLVSLNQFNNLYRYLMDKLCQGVPPPGDMGAPGSPLGSQTLDALVNRIHLQGYYKDQILKHGYGNSTFTYYSNGDIEKGGQFEMALVTLHGTMRDSRSYYCMTWEAVKAWHRLSGGLAQRQGFMAPSGGYPIHYKLEGVLILAPKYMYKSDNPLPTDVWWNGSKPWGDWRGAGNSDPRSAAVISSFAILNQVSLHLLNKTRFPNLHEIVMIGHSAGGQFVQRYSLMSHLYPHGNSDPSLDFRYVIANPSSYTYLDNRRWAYKCDDKSCTKPELLPVTGRYKSEFICSSDQFNNWVYGTGNLQNKYGDVRGQTVTYIDDMNYADAIARYPFRNMIYLVGQNDTCNDQKQFVGFCDKDCWQKEHNCFRNLMDVRCAAMLQGWNRRVRGYNYFNYLRAYFGRPVHNLFTVEDSGHNVTSMFLSVAGLNAIFGVL